MNKGRMILRVFIVVLPLTIIGILLNGQVEQIEEGYYDIGIVINEVMTDNLTVLENEKGNYSDWVELFNGSGERLKMSDYYLSDEKGELTKWRFPEVYLEKDEYLVIFCDADDDRENQDIHTNFMLNSDKETLYLSDLSGNIVDMMRLENQKCNVSYGRLYGKPEQMGFFSYSTVGYANPTSFWQQEKEADWGDIVFSHDGGVYEDTIELSFSHSDPDAVIFYTLNGSEPDITSQIYKGPITIGNIQKPNQYVNKKCVIDQFMSYETEYGVNEVDKATVVRTRVLKDGIFSSTIQTKTYFIGLDYTFPVVSLTVEPDTLFDDKYGNYVPGYVYHTMKKYAVSDAMTGNYSVSQDMSGHIEIYDNGTCIVNDDILFSMAGYNSLESNIQKSFNVFMQNERVNGEIFGTSDVYQYDCFTLRGSGGATVMDNMYAYPSSFISNYLGELSIGTQSSQPCILFIDGEYWGIYSLMEPKGKSYIEQHEQVEKKDISLVVPYRYETTGEFDELFEEISSKNFEDSSDYNWIKTKIDIENYMEFVIAEAYFGNADALKLGDHNLYIWKSENDRWKWQAYDFDSSLIDGENYFQNMLEFDYAMYGEGEDKKNFSIWLFQKLWICEEFKTDFERKLNVMCLGMFKEDSALCAFEEHILKLSQEMEKNLLRCERDFSFLKKLSFELRGIDTEYDNYTLEDWDNTIFDMKRYLTDRTETILEYLEEIM